MNQWLLAVIIVAEGLTAEIIIEPRHHTILLGLNVTITCTSVNSTEWTLCWYRGINATECNHDWQIYDNERVEKQLRERYSILNDQYESRLTIATTQLNDTGWICCDYCENSGYGSIAQLDVIDELSTISYESKSALESGSSASQAPLEENTTKAAAQHNNRYKIAIIGSVGIWIIVILILSILLIQRRCMTRSVPDPHTAVNRASTNDEGDVAPSERYFLQPQQTWQQLHETINGDTYALVPPRGDRWRNTESNETVTDLQPETATTDNANYTIDYAVDYAELSTVQRNAFSTSPDTIARSHQQRVDSLATYVRVDHTFNSVI